MRGAITPSLNFPACRQAGLFLFASRQKKDKKYMYAITVQQLTHLISGEKIFRRAMVKTRVMTNRDS
jgi:hypothetical protein